MTQEQREPIREVIGHLRTIEEQAGTETMFGRYAEILIDLLAVDDKREAHE